MSKDPVEEFFSDSGLAHEESPQDHETYPGSRHKRRTPPPPPVYDSEGWDKNGYVRIVGGKRVELFTVGSLAKALNRHPNSVRGWIANGYIPHAPFRLPTYTKADGTQVPGNRLWTRQMVEEIIRLFGDRDLLHSKRVEWSVHPDLPAVITERINALYAAMTSQEEHQEEEYQNAR